MQTISRIDFPNITPQDLNETSLRSCLQTSLLGKELEFLIVRLAFETVVIDELRKKEKELAMLVPGDVKGHIFTVNSLDDARNLLSDRNTGIVVLVDDVLKRLNPQFNLPDNVWVCNESIFYSYGTGGNEVEESNSHVIDRLNMIARSISLYEGEVAVEVIEPMSLRNYLRFTYGWHSGHEGVMTFILNPHPQLVCAKSLLAECGQFGYDYRVKINQEIEELYSLTSSVYHALYNTNKYNAPTIIDEATKQAKKVADLIHLPETTDAANFFRIPFGSVLMFGQNEDCGWHRGTFTTDPRIIFSYQSSSI